MTRPVRAGHPAARLIRVRALAIAAPLLAGALAGPAAAQTSPARDLGVEWAGASAGSATGVGLVLLVASPARCDGEDVGCTINRLALVGLASAFTAPAGAWIAGDLAGTDPHLAGAAIGSAVGVAGGVVALRALAGFGMEPRGLRAVVVYALAQGLATAAGSRIAAGMRE